MRVTFVLPALAINGGNKVAVSYAEHLLEQGHEVCILCPAPDRSSPKQGIQKFGKRWLGLKSLDGGTAALLQTKVPVTIGARPKILVPDDFPEADLVIATWWETAEWMASLPRSKGVKCHLVQDHEVFPYLPRDRVEAVYQLPWPKIVVSKWLERVCYENYAAQEVHCVPNGLDLTHFRDPGRAETRAMTVGMLWSKAPRKNSQMGLAAIIAAKTALPDLQAVFFGSSAPPSDIAGLDWINYHQLPDQSEIPEIYARCSAWLFSSVSEGFGLPLLEAMAMRTPVVSTRAGAAPELIDNANGLLVEGTAQAMAQGLIKILNEPKDAWQARSDASRRTAIQHDQKEAAIRFEAALKQVYARGV
ncbi:MAG: glycosyltransferase family 4 protein [Pseudomonadota bacterium]